MGQKVNPIGFRLGIVRDHNSIWYAEKNQFRENLLTDILVREHLLGQLSHASVSKVTIERTADNARVLIHTARPGVVIGKKGEDIDRMRNEITQIMKVPVTLGIQEIRKPDLDAQLVAESVAQQLEKRIMFRRAMKRGVQNSMRQGAKGVKIQVGGRLGGAEIARSEWYREGRVPLHTLRADVDYGLAEAETQYGIIGVKAWVFRGEILDFKREQLDRS
ncbi:MAG: 30S ribosomal protein S3 [SAR86 cluster bacterium]|jgi:small subunit ribosomal protein S3|nr:30S ribosomal protein S3 [SAR86 cluster bacterium]